MGNTDSSALTIFDKSMKLDSLSESIELILLAIEMKFVERDELGIALKVLKIREMTKEHLSANKSRRAKIVDRAHHYKQDLFDRVDALMTAEIASLKKSCAQLSQITKRIFNTWTVLSQDEMKAFADSVERLHANDIKYLNHQYWSNRNSYNFDSIVYKVGFRTLSETEENLIKSICVHTTYTFTNKNKRIDYSNFIKFN